MPENLTREACEEHLAALLEGPPQDVVFPIKFQLGLLACAVKDALQDSVVTVVGLRRRSPRMVLRLCSLKASWPPPPAEDVERVPEGILCAFSL